MSRFSTDDIFTGSTNQQTVVGSNTQSAPAATYATPAPAATSGKVGRSSLPPIGSAAPRAETMATVEPVKRKAAETASAQIDPLSRSVERIGESTKPKPATIATTDPAGWSSAGGSQITAKDGETVFNLSRRYGVPADVLMKINGLDDSGGLKTGQKVIIPTYIYSDRAPVSAPDNNPKVASAKSSRGVKSPNENAPLPADNGTKNLAVLPKTPKTKEAGELTAPADAKVPAGKGGSYTVAEGDSLSRIAKKHGVSVADLKAANGGGDGVRIGQQLKIPAAGVAAAKAPKIDPVQTASTPPKPEKLAGSDKPQLAAYTPPQKTKAIEAVESESDDAAPTSTGIGRMRWPAKGRVAKSRDGIDIQVPEGTAVKAAENGVVIYAGDGLKDFGNTVLVRHENGLVTVYGHASALNVKRGQKVKRGDQIATSGMSGEAKQPKLHFEVRKDSAPVDPSKYLE
ncbi:MAG: peptidoglycan DD-metalloendopeptidase family protein [Rhizobiaceae bacterium]